MAMYDEPKSALPVGGNRDVPDQPTPAPRDTDDASSTLAGPGGVSNERLSPAITGIVPAARPVFADEQWSADDEEMRRQIFAIFLALLRTLLRREDIEDLAQDVVVRVFVRSRTDRPVRHVQSWCRRIAHRKALKLLSKKDNRVRPLEGIDETAIVSRAAPTPPDEEDLAALDRAIGMLAPNRRLAVSCQLAGRSLEDTARLMRLKTANAKKMVSYYRSKALGQLRRLLAASLGCGPG